MRRILIIISTLLVAVPLTMGIMAGLSYNGTGEDSMPTPTITVMDTQLAPTGYDWQEPVFGGMLFRRFEKQASTRAENVGRLTQSTMAIQTPAGYNSRATVYFDGAQTWSGAAQDLEEYLFLEDGRYQLEVNCKRTGDAKKGSGSFTFIAAFTVAVEPELTTGESWVAQGDVFAIRLANLAGSAKPELECELGEFIFTPSGPGSMMAYIPVSWSTAEGDYTVTVRMGGRSWEIPMRVTSFNFATSLGDGASSQVDPAALSAEALEEFEEKVQSLYGIATELRQWTGRFVMPVEGGGINGEYGVIEYVNLRPTGQRSEGVEINAAPGTPVLSANAGQVLYADTLLNTGNTIVIDHGGGLKSYYYYMDELTMEPGDKVSAGQQIGTVGSTGAASSPHLRFEVRIGEISISPSLLLNGSSGLYTFEAGSSNGAEDE